MHRTQYSNAFLIYIFSALLRIYTSSTTWVVLFVLAASTLSTTIVIMKNPAKRRLPIHSNITIETSHRPHSIFFF
ncbi:hypothetical protein F5X99DRAFT_379304, partial [Biscogniauxia marginata]